MTLDKKPNSDNTKLQYRLRRLIVISFVFVVIILVAFIVTGNYPDIFKTKRQTSESAAKVGQYSGWKDCRNFGLNLSFKIPGNWECESNEVAHNTGFITITGDNFHIEIENIGRTFGCMEDIICKDMQIYDRDIISLDLVTYSGIDKYLYGIFEDSPQNRSYGGVYVTYERIGERKMTADEEKTLFKVLDSLTHNF